MSCAFNKIWLESFVNTVIPQPSAMTAINNFITSTMANVNWTVEVSDSVYVGELIEWKSPPQT